MDIESRNFEIKQEKRHNDRELRLIAVKPEPFCIGSKTGDILEGTSQLDEAFDEKLEDEWRCSTSKARKKIRRISQSEEKCKEKIQKMIEFFESDVAEGKFSNPLVKSTMSKSKCRRMVRRSVRYSMLRAANLFGYSNEVDEELQKSIMRLRKTNADIVGALLLCAGLGYIDFQKIASSSHKSAVVNTNQHVSDDEHVGCASLHCSFRSTSVTDISDNAKKELKYVVLSQGSYNPETLEVESESQDVDKKVEVICLCKLHIHFFMLALSFFHMEFNIFQNCKARIRTFLLKDKIPLDNVNKESAREFIFRLPLVISENLEAFYIVKYGQVWLHREEEEGGSSTFQMFGAQ